MFIIYSELMINYDDYWWNTEVKKLSEEIFTKIIKESYTPSVAEFMSGKVKSNDIALLQLFQKAFAL